MLYYADGKVTKFYGKSDAIKNSRLLDMVSRQGSINEKDYYHDPDWFDADLIKQTYKLEKIIFTQDELDTVLNNYIKILTNHPSTDLKFVVKQNGELAFTFGSSSSLYMPHPVLSNGEAVITAGNIRIEPMADGSYSSKQLLVNNHTGHFKASVSSLIHAINRLKKLGFDAIMDNPKYLQYPK